MVLLVEVTNVTFRAQRLWNMRSVFEIHRLWFVVMIHDLMSLVVVAGCISEFQCF